MIKLYSFITVIFLAGCTATSVIEPGGLASSQYAPVNEKQRTGMIKYLNAGASFVKEKRRENAYKKMYEKCNGKYKIVKEGTKLENGVIISSGPGTAFYSQSQYVYIEYRCI